MRGREEGEGVEEGREGQRDKRERGRKGRQNAHKVPCPPPVQYCHQAAPASQHLNLTSLITGCRSASDLTQTDILSKSSKVIGSFGIPDLPRWMMLDISSITSAANICGWSGEDGAGVARGG